ncbi:MAG: hypothetical protein KME49_25680 [Brasilonema octagenarum HA4186-MV1]|jgi:hypothetical protein|nr:hypothetical protein [Brasilonema octagenarum HA4186-MV1]
MLTTNQTEKVEVALSLIRGVKQEVLGIDYPKAVLLTKASDACDQVLQEDLRKARHGDTPKVLRGKLPPQSFDRWQTLPPGYVPPTEEWYSPKSIEKLLPAPTIGDRILNVLGWIAGTSLLSSALCGCIALSSWGLSEFKGALDTKILQETDFAAETKGYRGLAIAFFGVTLSASVLGAVVGDAVYRSND